MNLGSGQITQLTDGRNNNTEPTGSRMASLWRLPPTGAGVRNL